MDRIVPVIPPVGEKLPILIDSDVANEIDDLYALMIAIDNPGRFEIKGIVATHFAGGPPDGTRMSYELLETLLEKAGKRGAYPIRMGSHPMQYERTPTESEGVEFIIETARAASPAAPLWVIGIGAATNLAGAILKAPDIIPNVRYVYHARSEHSWPERSEQFNIYGDIIAAKTLLESAVPLVWFDTGTHICASYESTAERLAPLGEIGRFLHEYRDKREDFRRIDKGFFDMGDFAFLYDPSLGKCEVVDAPEMTRFMSFRHTGRFGKMLRVYDIDVPKTWELFYKGLQKRLSAG